MRLVFDDSNVRATAMQLQQQALEECRGKSINSIRDMLLEKMHLFFKDYPNGFDGRPDEPGRNIYANVWGYGMETDLSTGEPILHVMLYTRLSIDRETSGQSVYDLVTREPIQTRS